MDTKGLLRSYEYVLQALRSLALVAGADPDDPHRDGNLTEIRLELEHLSRRLRNTCLLHRVHTKAVETVERLGQ
jgi:hypothetical protein